MAKKIKLIAVFLTSFAVICSVVIMGLLYYLKMRDVPISKPVTKSPKAIELTNLLSENGLKSDTLPFESNNSIRASISGTLIIFSTDKSLKTQVKALQLLYQSLKMEPDKPKEIDLRFEKVVIRE